MGSTCHSVQSLRTSPTPPKFQHTKQKQSKGTRNLTTACESRWTPLFPTTPSPSSQILSWSAHAATPPHSRPIQIPIDSTLYSNRFSNSTIPRRFLSTSRSIAYLNLGLTIPARTTSSSARSGSARPSLKRPSDPLGGALPCTTLSFGPCLLISLLR